MSPVWHDCAPLKKCGLFSGPIKLSDNEFILAPSTDSPTKWHGLHKYNADKDSWDKFIKYSTPNESTDFDIAINDNNQTLMLYDFEGNLTTFDIHKKTANTQSITSWGEIGSDPRCVILDNQLHIICGYSSNKHYIYDESTKNLEIVHQFKEIQLGLYEHRLCHIKSQNKLLLFGGMEYKSGGSQLMDMIWEYDIAKQKWTKLDIKLPEPCRKLGVLLTNDERYLILFGGYTDDGFIKRIYLLDLIQMEWKESKYKCPCDGEFGAICMTSNGDERRNKYLVQGYVRELGVDNICDDIIGLVMKWLCTEWVHLLEPGNSFIDDAYDKCEANHWKANLMDILPN